MRPGIPVLAEVTEYDTYYETGNGDNTQSYSDLLSKYKTNSSTYKRNILDYHIQVLNGILVDENHANVNSQHLNLIETIEKLKQAKDALLAYKETLQVQEILTVTDSAIVMDATFINRNQELISEIDTQIANIDLQLQQYNSSKSSLQLAEDIADFYMDYQTLFTEEAKKKQRKSWRMIS